MLIIYLYYMNGGSRKVWRGETWCLASQSSGRQTTGNCYVEQVNWKLKSSNNVACRSLQQRNYTVILA